MDDETVAADASEADPTARGIVQCLHMLAEEAACLRLDRTLAALRTAMEVCAAEGDADALCMGVPPGILLH
jgi:hypothetical protein